MEAWYVEVRVALLKPIFWWLLHRLTYLDFMLSFTVIEVYGHMACYPVVSRAPIDYNGAKYGPSELHHAYTT